MTLWLSTHSYYAKHLFPRSVAGAKGEVLSVQVFQQLVRGLHVAIPEQADKLLQTWKIKSEQQFWPLLWLRHLDMLLVPVWGRQCKL